MSEHLLQDGQRIRDTYEVERYLGEGAFGEVYRVKHRFLGRQAMKVFKWVGLAVEEAEQMLGEALLLSRIGHPNIVRVFEANVTETTKGDCGFFTMEYVAGGSLDQFWRMRNASPASSVKEAMDIMRQVCQGLAVAHSENPPIIHRDIKPQNILVGYAEDGMRVRVSDFGLAKRVNEMTLLATARGDPNYKGPEAFRDPQGASRPGDVWGLGATLYVLLTERVPYTEPGREEPVYARFNKPLRLASELNPSVDEQLDQILIRALSLEPADRYPTAKDMLADLEKWQPPKNRPGTPCTSDLQLAKDLMARAFQLASEAGRLGEALSILERAINIDPTLGAEHEYTLQLWRRGITK